MNGLNSTTIYNTFKNNKEKEINNMTNLYDLYGNNENKTYYVDIYNDILDKETKLKNRMLKVSLNKMKKNYFNNILLH